MRSEHPASTLSQTAETVTAPWAALVGAGAGAAATLVMSMVMLPARWLGLLGTQPPRRVTDRLLDAAGKGATTPEPARRVGTAIVHLGTGAIGGALFGLARVLTARKVPAAVIGPAYGAGVWSAAYVVAAPAVELFPPPWEDRPARPQVMFVAHLVFGFVTAVLFDRVVGTGQDTDKRRR